MNVGSLFSGIGGMDEGLRRAGLRHVWFAEKDAYRRDVLRERFPGAIVYDDVRSVGHQAVTDSGARIKRDGEPRADARRDVREAIRVDLLAGGFPCQDVSVAGHRAGLRGDRSGLFYEFARIAESLRPGWLLVENVPGLLSSNGGRDFGEVLGTLADLGYGVAWRILDSRFFAVPQRRRRVFIVGALADGDPRAAAVRAGEVLAVGSRCGRHPATRGEAREDAPVASLSGLGNGGPDDNDAQAGRVIAFAGHGEGEARVANTLKVPSHGASWSGGSSDTFIAAPLTSGSHPNSNAPGRRKEDDVNLVVPIAAASVRRLTPTECERLQGLPDNWTQLGKTPDSKRYAALGDAVTANVAEWIGRRLMAASGTTTDAERPSPGSQPVACPDAGALP